MHIYVKRFANIYIQVLNLGFDNYRKVDLSPKNVEFAKQKAIDSHLTIKAIDGDAREIKKLINEKYDHVLLMGPLYHLLEEIDRVDTLNSCLSLLKPNGIIYISFISSYGGIIYSMKYEPHLITDKEVDIQYKIFEDDLPFSGDSFTQAHYYRHKDILPFMSQFNLDKMHFFGQEGILSPCEPIIFSQEELVV